MTDFHLPTVYRESWAAARSDGPRMDAGWVGRVAWRKTMDRLEHHMFWSTVICREPVDEPSRILYMRMHDRNMARYQRAARARTDSLPA
jgi:hypothetical protein